MNPKLQELVQNLLAGTRTGVLHWSATPEPGVYRLMLEKGLVRIYQLGGDTFVGCTVLNGEGNTLHDVQVDRQGASSLVTLYDLVNGGFQESALDDLLAEVRMKMQENSRGAPAGQR